MNRYGSGATLIAEHGRVESQRLEMERYRRKLENSPKEGQT